MPLDPQAQEVVDFIDSTELMIVDEHTDVVLLRAQTDYAFPSPVELPRIVDREIPGPAGAIPVRIYWPAADAPLPVVVFFHGGGFVMGGLTTHDDLCRRLTAETPCLLIAVDYRLAPEHPFPAANEDCVAALEWVVANVDELGGDPRRVALAGDSAGGNLAAATAQTWLAGGGARLALQVLIYPLLSHTFDQASVDENGEGMLLTRQAMEFFRMHYVPDPAQWTDPRNSPLRAEDLRGLPRACIITAECDPLRDQGRIYAAALRDADVTVDHHEYAGQFHGFVLMFDAIPAAKIALQDAVDSLRRAFDLERS